MKKRHIISTAAVIVRGSRVLLARRPRTARHFPGWWEFPGGKLKSGENPEAGLRRELREELGARVALGKDRFFAFVDCRDRTILVLAFLCRLRPGKLSPETELQWFTRPQLAAAALMPSDRPVREWALSICHGLHG